MHLSPPPVGLGCCPFKGGGSVVVDFLFIVTPIVGVCNSSMFCCTLLYVHSSIAIILMGKRELVALLNLFFWCLVVVERLFLEVPWGCLRFVIVVFPYHAHLLFLKKNLSKRQKKQEKLPSMQRAKETTYIFTQFQSLYISLRRVWE